jgi:hypothetical protein
MPCHCESIVERSEESPDLPGMIATLSSYDRLFGPRHVQTLNLAARIADVLRASGEVHLACKLLERIVRDLGFSVGRTHSARTSALKALRDLLLQGADVTKAIAIQTEIAECALLLTGPDHAETVRARTDLEALMMLHCGNAIEV